MNLRLLLLVYAFCFAWPDQCSANSTVDRPNVLLILVDDLKPSFGAYGVDWVHAPNLDRLAERGMRFDMAYCNQAVCAPSRNNLLLGSRSTSIGVYSLGQHFRTAVPDAVTMPQYFKQHGYHSAGVGKVFHIGHGNINDVHSWSMPFQPDKVIDYVLPESTGGKLTREEALFSNRSKAGLPMGAAPTRSPANRFSSHSGLRNRTYRSVLRRSTGISTTARSFRWPNTRCLQPERRPTPARQSAN